MGVAAPASSPGAADARVGPPEGPAVRLLAVLPNLVDVGAISGPAIIRTMTSFGGTSMAPLAVRVMAVEMTGSYQILAPAMISIFIAYVATGKNNLYHFQVGARLDSPADRDEFTQYPLENSATHEPRDRPTTATTRRAAPGRLGAGSTQHVGPGPRSTGEWSAR